MEMQEGMNTNGMEKYVNKYRRNQTSHIFWGLKNTISICLIPQVQNIYKQEFIELKGEIN